MDNAGSRSFFLRGNDRFSVNRARSTSIRACYCTNQSRMIRLAAIFTAAVLLSITLTGALRARFASSTDSLLKCRRELPKLLHEQGEEKFCRRRIERIEECFQSHGFIYLRASCCALIYYRASDSSCRVSARSWERCLRWSATSFNPAINRTHDVEITVKLPIIPRETHWKRVAQIIGRETDRSFISHRRDRKTDRSTGDDRKFRDARVLTIRHGYECVRCRIFANVAPSGLSRNCQFNNRVAEPIFLLSVCRPTDYILTLVDVTQSLLFIIRFIILIMLAFYTIGSLVPWFTSQHCRVSRIEINIIKRRMTRDNREDWYYNNNNKKREREKKRNVLIS